MWQIPNHTPQVIEGVGENAIDIPSGSKPQRQALLAGQVHRSGSVRVGGIFRYDGSRPRHRCAELTLQHEDLAGNGQLGNQ